MLCDNGVSCVAEKSEARRQSSYRSGVKLSAGKEASYFKRPMRNVRINRTASGDGIINK